VDLAVAEAVALRYRLDLLNAADLVDDAYRGAKVSKNAILPDLSFTGSATVESDPERLNSASFNTERTTWRGLLQLQMNDRKAERNAYRASIIAVRRAEREFEQAADTVRAEVRRAVRRLAQQEKLITIQALNVEENEFRLAAARAQFDLGRSTNQDVVDAENDLLNARNEYASAVAQYRNAILASNGPRALESTRSAVVSAARDSAGALSLEEAQLLTPD
jgi:outer membrane protein TolC